MRPTNIDLEEGTCSIDLLLEAAEFYSLSKAKAKGFLKQVATATRTWRAVAGALGASAAEIKRMESAFEHDEQEQALALS